MKKRILCALCCLLLLSVLPLMAFAREVPDFDRTGSISITMTYDGEAVSGGSLLLYQVAHVAENDGDYGFRYVVELENCGVNLRNLTSAQTAADIANAVQEVGLTGTKAKIDKNGNVTFDDLEIGLYLLVQDKAASGYNAVAPFLVAVPNMENGSYVYEVNATPKVELEPAPTTEPTDSTTGTTIPGKLPQTGQNSWPVPVMLVVGLLFVVTGCYLRISGKEKKHEA